MYVHKSLGIANLLFQMLGNNQANFYTYTN